MQRQRAVKTPGASHDTPSDCVLPLVQEEFEDEEGAEFEEKEYAVLVGTDAVGEDEEGDYQDEGEGEDDEEEEGEDEEDEGAEGAEPAAGGTKRKRDDEGEEGDE